MGRTTIQRTIDAPVERVFEVISDISNFSKAVPAIVRAEILSEVKSGKGTRFREFRRMGGKEVSAELEVTEFVANDRVRIEMRDVDGNSIFGSIDQRIV